MTETRHLPIKKLLQFSLIFILLISVAACRRESEKNITISFETNGGNTLANVSVLESQTSFTLPTPTKQGHTFIGWTVSPTSQTLFKLTDIDWEKTTLTLYAQWEINQYSITFITDSSDNLETQIYDFGESLEIPTELTRFGYLFDGWYTDEARTDPFTDTTMPDRDYTLYAKWIVDNAVFDVNTFFFIPSVKTEETVTITLTIGGDVQFSGYDIEILFDASKLSLTSYENHLNNTVNDSENGKIKFNYVDALNRIDVETSLITLSFAIIASGETTIAIQVIEIIDVTSSYEIINPEFKVISYTLD